MFRWPPQGSNPMRFFTAEQNFEIARHRSLVTSSQSYIHEDGAQDLGSERHAKSEKSVNECFTCSALPLPVKGQLDASADSPAIKPKIGMTESTSGACRGWEYGGASLAQSEDRSCHLR
ncbi:hypothetical protein CEXT_278341 [Caerostris extrusa]|uniref:Uncharacterized protein n=1 Tax=Caerostris extrusa TaxID=172846 RepID=A0AAV4W6W7_CAEEX|nr:hypothetical protein CEXT_278341 [Caerostris extrusa]